MRIMFVEHPVAKSVVFSWVTAENQRYAEIIPTNRTVFTMI